MGVAVRICSWALKETLVNSCLLFYAQKYISHPRHMINLIIIKPYWFIWIKIYTGAGSKFMDLVL